MIQTSTVKFLGILFFAFAFQTIQAADVTQRVEKVIATAESYLCTKHRMGGLSKKGIDCSGLMVKSFQAAKITLPRQSLDQSKQGRKVNQQQVRRGDLVFFKTSKRNRGKINHVGLVISTTGEDVWFIHTSSSKGVIVSRLSNPYWEQAFQFGRRILKGRLEETPGKFAFASERPLTSAELVDFNRKDRLTIATYILARNGYLFPDKRTYKRFQREKWYRRLSKNRNLKVVIRDMSPVEQDNLKLLGYDNQRPVSQRKRKRIDSIN